MTATGAGATAGAGGPPDEAALLARVRQALPALLGLWLFGSRAQGTAGADSDLDLAVLVPGKADPVMLWTLAGELAEIRRDGRVHGHGRR